MSLGPFCYPEMFWMPIITIDAHNTHSSSLLKLLGDLLSNKQQIQSPGWYMPKALFQKLTFNRIESVTIWRNTLEICSVE